MINSFVEGFRVLLPVLGALVLIGIAGFLVSVFSRKRDRSAGPDFSAYRLDPYLLSKAEFSFYHVLRQIPGDKYDVYPKVRLADIVKVQGGRDYQSAFNRIASKHVDFVICDTTSKVLMVVELDDSTHRQTRAQQSDQFKDGLFEAVGLRCVRFKAQRSYNVEEIKRTLFSKPVEKAEEISA